MYRGELSCKGDSLEFQRKSVGFLMRTDFSAFYHSNACKLSNQMSARGHGARIRPAPHISSVQWTGSFLNASLIQVNADDACHAYRTIPEHATPPRRGIRRIRRFNFSTAFTHILPLQTKISFGTRNIAANGYASAEAKNSSRFAAQCKKRLGHSALCNADEDILSCFSYLESPVASCRQCQRNGNRMDLP